jgi:alanyl-tRNA synthetase
VEFVCGYRALAAARGDFAALGQAASLLSCGLPDVPAVLAKMIEEKRGLHSAVKRLEERLAEQEARALLATGSDEKAGGGRIIMRALEEATPGYLGLIAGKLVGEAGVVALLASRETGHVVFAQSKGLPYDMGALLRETLKEFGGKGGGAKDFAQGSMPDPAKADELLARAAERLKK